jgi:RNA polymerase sigma factor (sigma-70 family)
VDVEKGLTQVAAVLRAEPRVSSAEGGFADFFRTSYRELVRAAMYAGATQHEAEEAAATTMKDVFKRWAELDNPLAYARRAVVNDFVKEKTRNLDRVRRRMAAHGAGTADGREDSRLTVWEDRQWVTQMLASLPPGQRDVMAFIVDGFTPTEIAALLGRSPIAIRQSLHAARSRLKSALQREQADQQTTSSKTGSARKETR